MEKGKAIKKKCKSAKMSRQRKKVYLELLEQKAEELKAQISNRKRNVRAMAEDIMDKFSSSNREVTPGKLRSTTSSARNSQSASASSPCPRRYNNSRSNKKNRATALKARSCRRT